MPLTTRHWTANDQWSVLCTILSSPWDFGTAGNFVFLLLFSLDSTCSCSVRYLPTRFFGLSGRILPTCVGFSTFNHSQIPLIWTIQPLSLAFNPQVCRRSFWTLESYHQPHTASVPNLYTLTRRSPGSQSLSLPISSVKSQSEHLSFL